MCNRLCLGTPGEAGCALQRRQEVILRSQANLGSAALSGLPGSEGAGGWAPVLIKGSAGAADLLIFT